MPNLRCAHCGADFYRKDSTARYCSAECGHRAQRTAQHACSRCGNPVRLTRNRYCSKACSNAARWDAGVYGERGGPGYRERYERDRPKHLARAAARYVVPLGPACEDCGATDDLHRHHDDYSRPLDVRTLCRRCHSRAHPAAAEAHKARAAARRG